jgi:putative addiction module component (TIGR02574 family)
VIWTAPIWIEENDVSATDTLIRKALQLPDVERHRVLEALLESFPDDGTYVSPEDSEWSAELRRRGDELDADPAAARSFTEVRRQLEADLGAFETESRS